MEQRFTFKDFFLFAFLGVLFITILLSMYMVDRQWQAMAQTQRTLVQQAEDLRHLRGAVSSIENRIRTGIHVGDSAAATAGAEQNAGGEKIPGAFQRAYETAQREDYAEGDWLVQAFGTGLKTITPLISSDVYSAEVQGYVLESLLVRNPETLDWQGLIARDWTVSEDGLTITFQMRKDVRFSDGHPMDAQDVAFTFNFIMDPKIAAPRQRAYFEKIESVTAADKYEVVFKFEEPYFESLALAGGMGIMAEHFYGPYLEKPRVFNESRGLLLGSGPYRLPDPKGWTPDQGLAELERNPYYWGPVFPSFDRLLWKVIENDSARLTTFRNGEIDVYGAMPREYQTLLRDEELAARTRHLEYMSPTAGYNFIGWNQKRGGEPTLFADRRVRQAMTYLTNRQRIVEEVMLGYAEIAVSPFSPRSPQHDDDIDPRPFDLEKAQTLLADAGFEDRNGDGVLENKEGKPFEFDLSYFQSNPITEGIVLLLRDLYAQAGILMHLQPTEWSVMLESLEHKNFDAITLGWSSGVEVDVYQMFHSSQTVEGGDNFINYVNPRLDKILEAARSTVDEEQRMPLWHKAERILYEDQPYTFLMRSESLVFIRDRIKNIEVTRLGLNRTAVPVEWYVPAAMQRYTR